MQQSRAEKRRTLLSTHACKYRSYTVGRLPPNPIISFCLKPSKKKRGEKEETTYTPRTLLIPLNTFPAPSSTKRIVHNRRSVHASSSTSAVFPEEEEADGRGRMYVASISSAMALHHR